MNFNKNRWLSLVIAFTGVFLFNTGMTLRVATANDQSITEAADLLRAGRLVAIPTETVYGLAANACDGVAVAKIFAAKGRPQFNPLIIHTHSIDALREHVVFNEQAEAIAQQFWPGPLTMILPRAAQSTISDLASAGLPTLAVRVPDHAVARKVLEQAGVPVAAPSANTSGSVSPTAPHHVIDSLGDRIDMVLAAGPCRIGLESTVLDMSGDEPVILRAGAITAEDIESALGIKVAYELTPKEIPKSPGQLLRHYATSIPVRLNAVDVAPDEALLAFGSLRFMGIQGGGYAKTLPADQQRNLSEQGDLFEAAANLFSYLRQLDQPQFKGIAVMNIPNTGIGIAVNERLSRAAASG